MEDLLEHSLVLHDNNTAATETGATADTTTMAMAKTKTKTTKTKTTSVAMAAGLAEDLLEREEEPLLCEAIAQSSLPAHYNFELHKTVHMIRKHRARRVALQMPEGLLMFATTIATLLESCAYPGGRAGGGGVGRSTEDDRGRRGDVRSDNDNHNDGNDHNHDDNDLDEGRTLETVILADVTYGACCVDDFTARALECDLLVHYGHSCLVPVTNTSMPTLYVFVDIQFPVDHLLRSIPVHFPPARYADRKIHVVGTIQFAATLPMVCRELRDVHGYRHVNLPQERPLSPGEILGCTSPKLPDADLIMYVFYITRLGWGVGFDLPLLLQLLLLLLLLLLRLLQIPLSHTPPPPFPHPPPTDSYVGDGRFHLESIMLANPQLTEKGEVYRYDPYTRKFTREHYAYQETMRLRKQAIEDVRAVLQSASSGRRGGDHPRDTTPATTNSTTTTTTSATTTTSTSHQGETWVGILWGTLGRQGSPSVVRHLQQRFQDDHPDHRGNVHVLSILLSEISPQRLALFQPPPPPSNADDPDHPDHYDDDPADHPPAIRAWIQTSCPRLSVDWGYAFDQPLLSPYEAVLALLSPQEYRQRMPGWMRALDGAGGGAGPASHSHSHSQSCSSNECTSGTTTCTSDTTTTSDSQFTFPQHGDYPMDFYAKSSLGPWTPNYRDPAMVKKASAVGPTWKQRLEARRRLHQQQNDQQLQQQQQNDQQQH